MEGIFAPRLNTHHWTVSPFLLDLVKCVGKVCSVVNVGVESAFRWT